MLHRSFSIILSKECSPVKAESRCEAEMRSCENLPEMFHVKLFEQGDKSLAL